MRLNVSNYRDILSEKGLTDDQVCKSTGLSEKTLLWILENGFIECETLERIADAVGCKVEDILKSDPLPKDEKCTENVIEWIKDQDRATLTFSQRRTITKVKRLAERYPEECQIVAENQDGSICAHVPVSWVKILPPKKVSEERRELSRRLMKDFNSKRASVTRNNG